MSFTVIVGDIHGMADELRRLLSDIDMWLASLNCNEPGRALREPTEQSVAAEEIEAKLAERGLKRAYRNHKLLEAQKATNKMRSKARARNGALCNVRSPIRAAMKSDRDCAVGTRRAYARRSDR
jgi:hypothetical protein